MKVNIEDVFAVIRGMKEGLNKQSADSDNPFSKASLDYGSSLLDLLMCKIHLDVVSKDVEILVYGDQNEQAHD